MNTREKFLETMKCRKGIPPPKWEFGYWGSTIKRWYQEGLPQKVYPAIPTRTATISSSLYTMAWTHAWRRSRTLYEKIYGEPQRRVELPDGIGVWGGALYWPSQGFPLDADVTGHFQMDPSTILVQVEQLFHPAYETRIIEENDLYLDHADLDGITRRYHKEAGVVPISMAWPLKDRAGWEEIRAQRLREDTILQRFPANWDELCGDYRRRSYPLALGGYPLGCFGTLAHLMGYENLFYAYYDQPALLHDVLGHLTRLWLAIWEEVLSRVEVDCVHIWEDISAAKGSMVSPAMVREFMLPYYRRITDFLKGHGVEVILVDTDGNCSQLIPLFLEAGITGLYPMEVSAGMDVVAARQAFPHLPMMGGIPKSDIALGPRRIDEFLETAAWLLESGGYIPFGDHLIPPEVSWENFCYYREKLNRLIDHLAAY